MTIDEWDPPNTNYVPHTEGIRKIAVPHLCHAETYGCICVIMLVRLSNVIRENAAHQEHHRTPHKVDTSHLSYDN